MTDPVVRCSHGQPIAWYCEDCGKEEAHRELVKKFVQGAMEVLRRDTPSIEIAKAVAVRVKAGEDRQEAFHAELRERYGER